MANSELSIILCGDYQGHGELSEILEHLATTVDKLAPKCYEFIMNQSNDVLIFGAYCGRALLETACTILIGRITPYRLLLLKRYQEQPSYKLESRHKASIQWKGDIIAPEKAPDNLWTKIDDNNLTKPLLSDYMANIYWIPAYNKLLDDFFSDSSGDDSFYLNSLKTFRNPDDIVKYFKSEADVLYSSLSKGVHQEFVIPFQNTSDDETIPDLLRRTIALVVKMALISHYISNAITKTSKNTLLYCLEQIESMVGVR